MLERSKFISELRKKFFARNPERQEFTNEFLKQAIEDSLKLYSRYCSRKNLLSQIAITAGSRLLLLPTDFLSAEKTELHYIATGERLRSPFLYGRLSVNSDLVATIDSPSYFISKGIVVTQDRIFLSDEKFPPALHLTTTQEGQWALALSQIMSTTVERELRYDALHKCDEDAFTVPLEERNIFSDLVLATICRVLEQDSILASRVNPEASKQAALWRDIGQAYEKSLSQLRGFGGIG